MDNWKNELGEYIREELRTGRYAGLCKTLGLEYGYWMDSVLAIAGASLHASMLLPDTPWLDTAHVPVPEDGALLAGSDSLPFTGPCLVEPVSWPCSNEVQVELYDVDKVSVTFAGRMFVAGFTEEDGMLKVSWPAGIGLSGNLAKDSLPATLHTTPSYPSDFVISLAKADDNLYTLLTDAGYEAAFYQEADSLEQVAILVLALYKVHKRRKENGRG